MHQGRSSCHDTGCFRKNTGRLMFGHEYEIVKDVKIPFKLEGGNRIDDTPVHKALREALANCLINADYCGSQGIVIIKQQYLNCILYGIRNV